MNNLREVARELRAWVGTLGSAAIYATLIVTFIGQVARVDGSSMQPTLEDNDRLVVNKLAYRLHKPVVGDVVTLIGSADPPQATGNGVHSKAEGGESKR